MKNCKNRYMRNYTPEEDKWLKENIEGKFWREVTEEFNKLFEPKRTKEGIKQHCRCLLGITNNALEKSYFKKNHKCWNKGLSTEEVRKHFKKGQPHTVPIGTVSTRTDGLVQIKISENKWKPYTRYLWEKENNIKLKTTETIVHLDGNRQNNNINNLMKTTRPIMTSVLKGYYNTFNIPEITRTAIMNEELRRTVWKKQELNYSE